MHEIAEVFLLKLSSTLTLDFTFFILIESDYIKAIHWTARATLVVNNRTSSIQATLFLRKLEASRQNKKK